MRGWLGSDKTSFAVQFAVYLINNQSIAYFLNASRTVNDLNGGMSMGNATWFHIRNKSRDRPIYVIIDEAQAWYPGDVLNEGAGQEVDTFWSGIKGLQENTSL